MGFSSCPLRVFLCLSTYLLILLRGGSCLYLCGWSSTSGSVKVCRQAEAHSLLFYFSLQCHNVEQRKRSDKHRSNSIVCLILAICNYTHLFCVMFLQWGTTIWLALHFLLFVIFLRVFNQRRPFLISYCKLQQNCKQQFVKKFYNGTLLVASCLAEIILMNQTHKVKRFLD